MPTKDDQWWLTRDKTDSELPETLQPDNFYAVWFGTRPYLNEMDYWDATQPAKSVLVCARVWEALYPHLRLEPGECVRIKPIKIEKWEETP